MLEFRANRRADWHHFQRHWPDRFHFLFLSRARHRRRQQPERLLQHGQRQHSCSAGHHPAHSARKLDVNRCFSIADQPGVDRFDRQRWRDRLSRRALPRSWMLEFRANRRADWHHFQRHWPDRFHFLFLSRARHRRRQQLKRLFQHGQRQHSCSAGHHATNCTNKPDSQRGYRHADQSFMDGLDR